MKKILITLLAVAALSSTCLAQTVTLSYNDGDGDPAAGSYMPGSSFSFGLTMTTAGQMGDHTTAGTSYWFESASSGYFFVGNRVFGASFFDDNQSSPDFAANGGLGEEILPGGNASDLGGTDENINGVAPEGQPPNTSYFLATLTINIAPGTPNGIYTIFPTTGATKNSIATDFDASFNSSDIDFPATPYTITVVPEPSTFALVVLGGLGALGLNVLRAKRRQ